MLDAIRDLSSQDPHVRFRALVVLRSRYEPEVGDALINHLIAERAPGVWWLAATCVLPIWLPAFDNRLRDLPQWPFSGARTIQVLELSRGHVLHSAQPFVSEWLKGAKWTFKFAAFRWLQIGSSTMAEIEQAALLLLSEIHLFTVQAEGGDFTGCSWMNDFDDLRARKMELDQYLEDIGD